MILLYDRLLQSVTGTDFAFVDGNKRLHQTFAVKELLAAEHLATERNAC